MPCYVCWIGCTFAAHDKVDARASLLSALKSLLLAICLGLWRLLYQEAQHDKHPAWGKQLQSAAYCFVFVIFWTAIACRGACTAVPTMSSIQKFIPCTLWQGDCLLTLLHVSKYISCSPDYLEHAPLCQRPLQPDSCPLQYKLPHMTAKIIRAVS